MLKPNNSQYHFSTFNLISRSHNSLKSHNSQSHSTIWTENWQYLTKYLCIMSGQTIQNLVSKLPVVSCRINQYLICLLVPWPQIYFLYHQCCFHPFVPSLVTVTARYPEVDMSKLHIESVYFKAFSETFKNLIVISSVPTFFYYFGQIYIQTQYWRSIQVSIMFFFFFFFT